jgi:hypothetical protein
VNLNEIVQLGSGNPEASNNGAGVQLDARISYCFTSQFGVGVGARYWALWATDGQVIPTADNGVPITATQPQVFKGAAEQAGVFSASSPPLWTVMFLTRSQMY